MLKIGGLEKSSLIDYPGKVSAIIFTYGCNLRCPYCHNPELVTEKLCNKNVIPHRYIFDFLKKRVGKLDAVVITGGEPLIHDTLEPFIRKIKKLGYLVKLDTNGFYPEKLKNFIDKSLIDYIAMDIKYPKSKYIKLTERKDSTEKVLKSINLIMNSGIDYEFRTTYVKFIHDLKAAEEIGKIIKGVKNYYIQNFRAGKTINPLLNEASSFTQKELRDIKKVISKYVENVHIR
jgi:pyruvate formate lyase activating enzyme